MPDRPRALLDTGAILALLDRGDRWHRLCSEVFKTIALPLATSAAVLTELFHLLAPHESAAGWRFVRSGAVVVLPIGDPDLADLEMLMHRYSDRSMDFADATLVHLATRESLATVFTVDRSDFETYRFGAKRPFRILPEGRP